MRSTPTMVVEKRLSRTVTDRYLGWKALYLVIWNRSYSTTSWCKHLTLFHLRFLILIAILLLTFNVFHWVSVTWRAYIRAHSRWWTWTVDILVSIKHEAFAIDFSVKRLLLTYLRAFSSLELALLLLMNLRVLLWCYKSSTVLKIVSWLRSTV